MHKPQLFLLHFAGGNVYSFNQFMPFLTQFECIPLELPGRGKRVKEPLITEFDEAAEDMFRQLKSKYKGGRFAIYGHSMGAYLGLRVTNMLAEEKLFPDGLIVSGNPGPGIDDHVYRYQLEYQPLIEELKRLGGIPDELYENEELLRFFIPILKADFEVAEKNDISEEPPVAVPLFALMGTEEEDKDKLHNWGRFTTSTFGSALLPGGHFFIHKHPAEVAASIIACTKGNTAQEPVSPVVI